MKKLTFILCTVIMLAVSGCRYDDSLLNSRVDDLEKRVSTLEEICNRINTNVSSLQTLVNALQEKDYITSVTPITVDDNIVGYNINFTQSPSITIYHGKNGKDGMDGKDGANGYTPTISVKQDTDGHYYWTLDGEWLIGNDGKKIMAEGVSGKDGQDGVNGSDGKDGQDGKDGINGSDGQDGKDGKDGNDGEDGITPQFKIEDGNWYISIDNGQTWKYVGRATGSDGQNGADGKDGVDGKDGESMFNEIDTSDQDFVIFVLTNGTRIKIPTWYAFEELKKLCDAMNANIKSLQIIVDAMKDGDYIVSCTPVVENGIQIGYSVSFAKNGTIVIYNGKNGVNGENGQDGNTPVIGTKRDKDGILYWTVNGEWMLDETKSKIRVSGKDGSNGSSGSNGITPLFKIEGEYWYVSYDDGDNWTQLGKAKGEDGKDGVNGIDGQDGVSIFDSVWQDDNYLYVVLTESGEKISIPKSKPFSITFEREEFTVQPNSKYILKYTIAGGDDRTQIKVYEKDGLKAKIIKSSNTSGSIQVTTPDLLNQKIISELIVLVNDGNDRTLMRSLSFVKGIGRITNNSYALNSEATVISTTLSTNFYNYKIEIPAEAQHWIKTAPVSRAEMREDNVSFSISENTGNDYRYAVVEIKDDAGITFENIFIFQRGKNSKAVHVASAGKLSSLISAEERNTLVDLKITGQLNTNDYTFIKELTKLRYLDLSGLYDAILPESAFSRSKIRTIFLPSNLVEIGYSCFMGSAITSISLPESMTIIRDNAFKDCKSIRGNLHIPDGVTEIGSSVFENCGFDGELRLGKGLVKIGLYAFRGCSMFKGDLIIPDDVTSIGSGAFLGCTGFRGALVLGTNIQVINNNAFIGGSESNSSAGGTSYYFCTKLNFKKVFCKSTTVPKLYKAFGFSPESYPPYLGVPEGWANTYKADVKWSYFETIEEVDFDALGY